jgi:ribosomal peptide maturation radical SAM protein 1
LTDPGEIVLVCMPFGPMFSPSIGLSLLKAELAAQGMPARVRYFSIPFAERMGQAFYYGLSSESIPSIQDLAGEWIFSASLFGPGPRDEEYIDQILRKRGLGPNDEPELPASPALIARILTARRQADAFLQWCREDVLRGRPKLVGFTSMFQQHAASLALARLIKQARPETFIVFGGANCEDVMGAETVRQFHFVDAVVSGEADLVFPELARRVLEGRPVSGLPGIRTRDGVAAEFASGRFGVGPMVRDLDALPYPDYGDYFEQFQASRFGRDWLPAIFLETSRGCWWGERMHCTFCGLNPATMAFRSKSPPRALEELACLTASYPGCDVEVTDNILDMRYFKDFVPEVARRSGGSTLFYEVKANLKKQQLRMLRDAGIRSIQPGIESFSDPVLKLMRKGVSALQNIQLLKWCKELGVEPSWNLLWGFPGEPLEEYDRMARLVPLLTHLPPPGSDGLIRLDRFSPNFQQAEQLGFTDVTPLPAYQYVYPFSGDVLANLAYYFAFRYREPRDVNAYVRPLEREVRAWRRLEEKQDLFSVDTGKDLLLWDLRPAGRSPLTVLGGADRLLYQACDSACDLRQLDEMLGRSIEGPLSPDAIEQRLAPLVERGLLVRDGSRYLALAIPLGEYSPPAPAVERFYDLLKVLGTRLDGGWVVSAGVAPCGDGRAPTLRNARPRGRRRVRHRARRLMPSQFSTNADGEVFVRRIGSH